jgi:ABC-type transport system substrate-binding protein
VIPAGMFGHVNDLLGNGFIPQFSPNTAKILFEHVGWRGSISIFSNAGSSTRLHTSLALKNTIEDLGVGITINVVELTWSTFLDETFAGNVGIYNLGWGADYPDGYNFVVPFYHSTEGIFARPNNYHNPLVDQLINEVGNETDPDKRVELFRFIEQNATSDFPMIYFLQPIGTTVMKAWIEDFQYSGSLNPARSEWRFAYLGKPDVWYPPENPSTSVISDTTSVSSTNPDFSSGSNTENSGDIIIQTFQNIFAIIMAGGIGISIGIATVLLIRRNK